MLNFSASPIRGLVAFLWCVSSSNRMLVWQNENFLSTPTCCLSEEIVSFNYLQHFTKQAESVCSWKSPTKSFYTLYLTREPPWPGSWFRSEKMGDNEETSGRETEQGSLSRSVLHPMLNIYFEYMPKIRYLQCFQCAHASSKSHTDLLLMYFSCKATDPQLIPLISNAFMFRTLKHRDEHMGVKLHVINVR